METIIGVFLLVYFVLFIIFGIIQIGQQDKVTAKVVEWALFATSVWYLVTHYIIK